MEWLSDKTNTDVVCVVDVRVMTVAPTATQLTSPVLHLVDLEKKVAKAYRNWAEIPHNLTIYRVS